MDKKKEQLLVIEPQNELKFRGPFNTHVTSRMRLTNPSDKVILFKIKTTAPKKYCVRPNCGTLNPQESTEVNIVLQPFIFDPAEKNRHKFMVQSVIAPRGADQYGSMEQVWKEINPNDLMDSKLRCVFEVSAESGAAATLGGNPLSSSGDEQATFAAASSDVPSAFKMHGGAGDSSATITSSDSVKAAAELRQLREEESQLRQENLMLKEQVLRLRMALEESNDSAAAAAKTGGSASTVWSGNSPSYQPNAYAPPNLPVSTYIIIAVLVGILCMLFGKFVL